MNKIKNTIILIAIAALFVGGFFIWKKINVFEDKTDISEAKVIEQIKVKEFESTKASYEVLTETSSQQVIDKFKKIFNKNAGKLIVQAKVNIIAGIKLDNQPDSLPKAIIQDRKLTITLPKAQILEATLDFSNDEEYKIIYPKNIGYERISEINDKLINQAKENAKEDKLIELAQDNLKSFFEGFYKSTKYFDEVVVQFI